MLIKGERVYLGPLETSDAPTVQEWMNELELCRLFWMDCQLPKTLDGVAEWIHDMNRGSQTGLLSIRRLGDAELIGMFTLRKFSRVSGSIRFGSALWPPELWSQGLGTEARRAFLNYAFIQLGLRRVFGAFAAYNMASRKSHEKLGAEISVVNREALFMDGCYHDIYQYVYRRETYRGFDQDISWPEEAEIPWEHDEVKVGKSVERTYSDFYGRPDKDGEARELWGQGKIYGSAPIGRYILIPDVSRRCDLLIFPEKWLAPDREILLRAMEHAFRENNFHRIQMALPGPARLWEETILSCGFQFEGGLDRLVFAEGCYHDLLFYGIAQ